MSDPIALPVDGTRRVIWLATVANILAVTIVEANAGKFLDRYITGDGWIPSGDQETIKDARLRSTQTFEQPGRKARSLALRYTYNLKAPTSDEARITLAEGTQGYLLNVLQKPDLDGDILTATDWYEAWPAICGEQMVVPSEENAVDRIDQKIFIRGKVIPFRQFV